MPTPASMVVRITADFNDLKSELSKTGLAITSTTKSMEKLANSLKGDGIVSQAAKITAVISQMADVSELTTKQAQQMLSKMSEGMAKLKATGEQIPANMQRVHAELTKVAGATATFEQKAQSAWTTTKGFLGAIGIQFGVAQVMAFGRSVFDTADKIVDLSNKMGVSVEAAQRFRYAARQSGADIEQVSTAIVKMSERLADGDKSTVAALQRAGLSFAQIRQLKPEDAFRAIADAIGRIPDPMRQAQVALDLFGKGGAELLPMIRENSLKAADGIRVMSTETIHRLEAAKQSWENFWEAIIIRTGEALATLATQWENTKALFSGNFGGVKTTQGPSVLPHFLPNFDTTTAYLGAVNSAEKALKDIPAVAGAFQQQAHAVKSASQALHEFNKVNTLTIQQVEKTIAATERLNEKYQAWKRAFLGLSDARREVFQFEQRLIKEGLMPQVPAMAKVEDQTARLIRVTDAHTASLKKNLDVITARLRVQDMSGIVSPISSSTLFAGAMSGASLLGQANTGYNWSGIIKEQLRSAANAFPSMLSAAILHGQSITQALRATLAEVGGSLGKTWGESLAKSGSFLSKGLGSLFSAGAAIGLDFLMKGVSALISKFQNVTKGTREGFAGELGFDSLDALYKRLQAMGPEGARLANVGLNVIGKQDKAANEKWMKDVQAFLGKASADTDRLAAAMEKYGFTWEQMGQKARNSRIGEMANELLETFRVLTDKDLGGIASDEVLKAMSGDFSALVQSAKKSATEIPYALRPTLQRLAEMGLLLDENGEKIGDLNSLNFAKTLTEGFDQVTQAIYDLTYALTGVPRALDPMMDAFTGVRPRNGDQWLHGGAGGTTSRGTGQTQVVINLDGREIARATASHLPEEYRYLALA